MESKLKSEVGIIVALEATLYCYYSVKTIGVPSTNPELTHSLYVVSEKCNRMLLTMDRTPKVMILNDCCKVIEMLTAIAFDVRDNACMFARIKDAHRSMLELVHENM